LRTDSSLKMK